MAEESYDSAIIGRTRLTRMRGGILVRSDFPLDLCTV
jgi:hypothetical protein